MHKYSVALIALSVGLFSASQAKASVLDTFVLTGDGNTFSFSLPSSSSPGTPHSPCSFGDLCYGNVSVTDVTHNGTSTQIDTIDFGSDGDLEIFNSQKHEIVDLSLDGHHLEFSDSHGSVSFTLGTYNFDGDDNGFGDYDWNSRSNCGNYYDGYTLTITDPPPASPVPEPSSLALMSTGLLTAAGAIRRRMKK